MVRANENSFAAARFLGILALSVFFLIAIAVIAALTFAVHVSGQSMTPTVRENDRLSANFLAKDIDRFDLVEARFGGAGPFVVKRVIGLPGDTLWVELDGETPVVHIQPTGTEQVYNVVSPTWSSQIGANVSPCCNTDGTNVPATTPVRIAADSYWIIGDNWGGSDDSRNYGFVTDSDISATLNIRILPLSEAGTIANPFELVAQ